VLIDDEINTDEFFSIGDENSNEWMADDNIDDHIDDHQCYRLPSIH
jgi:hypothetical protein